MIEKMSFIEVMEYFNSLQCDRAQNTAELMCWAKVTSESKIITAIFLVISDIQKKK